jgi:hypothetical protein
MKTSIFKWEVLSSAHQLGTRPAGVRAREHVHELLAAYDKVILDFAGRQATPSFVDELIGGLEDELGSKVFHERLTVEGVSRSLAPLVRHVLAMRRSRRSKSVA